MPGTDFLLDKDMKPWLIEFSKTPSAHDSFKEPGSSIIYSIWVTESVGRLMPGLVSELTEILLEIQTRKREGEVYFDTINSLKNWKRIVWK
jgi:hypothetical protein